MWGSYCTYTIGIRVAHIEKFIGVSRFCLGFEDIFDAVCAAYTHGESRAAYEDHHIVLFSEEKKLQRENVMRCDGSVRIQYALTWDQLQAYHTRSAT
jgi:hypothetical protein